MTSRGPADSDDGARIDASTLPEEVREMWETMLRLDPNWSLNEWLVARAKEELKLIEANLGRERMRLEQRLSRVETLVGRLKRLGHEVDEVRWTDPHQRNLFDVYSKEEEIVDASEDDSPAEQVVEENHPATSLIDYLPGTTSDDPLLAIVAQHILVEMEDARAVGALPISLEELEKVLEGRGISPDELVEAIEWLLERAEIIEVAEDFFAFDS